jgi:hypothetical protein
VKRGHTGMFLVEKRGLHQEGFLPTDLQVI